MNILIMVLIILAVAGSIFWVVPSRREKELATMRTEALGRGFRVHIFGKAMQEQYFRFIEDYRLYMVYERAVQGLDVDGVIALHGDTLVLPEDDDALLPEALLAPLARSRECLTQIKAEHDLDFPAILLKKNQISVIWKEKGGEEGVQALDRYVQVWTKSS